MNTFTDFLWPIILFGSCGGFIDFLIGKSGQENARNWLLKWWIRFDDIRWNNFGKKEGIFAGHLISKLLGDKLWSCKRVFAALSLLAVSLILVFLRLSFSERRPIQMCDFCGSYSFSAIIPGLMISLVSFCVSVSFTKAITIWMASLCGSGQLRNLIIFTFFLLLHYLMLAIWLPATNYIKVTVTEDFLWEPPSTLLELADHFKFGLLTIILWFKSSPWISFHGFISFKDGTTSIEDFTMFILSCFPIMCRLLISILFVGSFFATATHNAPCKSRLEAHCRK